MRARALIAAAITGFGLAICGATSGFAEATALSEVTGTLGSNQRTAYSTRDFHHIPTGSETAPPLGHVVFCKRHPSECREGEVTQKAPVLNRVRWRELNEINGFVNDSVPQISDLSHYNLVEWWDYPDERGGDCEDMALLKRRLLIKRGWPQEALLLATGKDAEGEGHAVLLVATDQGDLVLDNRTSAVLDWRDAPYRWLKRQSPEDPGVWVSLVPPARAAEGRNFANRSLSAASAPRTGLRPALDMSVSD